MKWHRGSDPWGRNSYPIPEYAIVGSSDCGEHADSPAPSDRVASELEDFRQVLRRHGIRSRIRFTQSGNVFMLKRWVAVHSRDYARAKRLAKPYLAVHHDDTRYIHDAA